VVTDSHEAALVLEDGSVFVGRPFGARTEVAAEIVFNTGMTGYEEVVSDPSYRGQMVVMTHPQIGNYGVAADRRESARPWVEALVVRELARRPHHWEARGELGEHLAEWRVPGIEGIDTRALVRRLRGTGTQLATVRQSGPNGFGPAERERLARETPPPIRPSQQALIDDVSGWAASGHDGRVTLLDLGLKWSIVRSLERRGISPRVMRWDASAEAILESAPRAIVVSNGPGDPAALPSLVRTVRALYKSGVPMLGICLGHQLLGLAAGATTSRLRYGHHGGNHPVRDTRSGVVTITTQNHEFQVDAESIRAASGLDVSHVNLNDGSIEGLRHRELPVWSVQFHPEGAPGPRDGETVFDSLLAVAGLTASEVA
jgi:carbamoyl-phosphate synthase small subunit